LTAEEGIKKPERRVKATEKTITEKKLKNRDIK
jgi:hypothetical protein